MENYMEIPEILKNVDLSSQFHNLVKLIENGHTFKNDKNLKFLCQLKEIFKYCKQKSGNDGRIFIADVSDVYGKTMCYCINMLNIVTYNFEFRGGDVQNFPECVESVEKKYSKLSDEYKRQNRVKMREIIEGRSPSLQN